MTRWMKGQPAEWVTETEPEYDANERDNWYARWEYDQALCPQCGNLRSICEDPGSLWNPQITTCYASASQTMYSRDWHGMHADTKPDEDNWHPNDGVLVWVAADLPPDPTFTPTAVGLPAESRLQHGEEQAADRR